MDAQGKPTLIFFTSRESGRCRRVEGYLSQVLQRRSNHETFAIRHVAQEERPDLFERFRIAQPPTLVVVEGNRVRARLAQARGAAEIGTFLAPWLK
jgi:thioredoxin-like negative regulator of GroEL